MRARAAKDLLQLSDPDFFRSAAEGLALVIENAERLQSAANALFEARHPQGTKIMSLLADEEAAKFLILLDAVRCPRSEHKLLTRQLGYMYDHLARSVYAKLAWARPVDLAELERYAREWCETLYLDGPNDVDWIYRNEILADREDAIYVDYVESERKYEWLAPSNDELLIMSPPISLSLEISRALHKTGMITPEGLQLVANIWRSVKVQSGLCWKNVAEKNEKTLHELGRIGLLRSEHTDVYLYVVSRWPMPLYTLDLGPINVKRSELEAIQQKRRHDY